MEHYGPSEWNEWRERMRGVSGTSETNITINQEISLKRSCPLVETCPELSPSVNQESKRVGNLGARIDVAMLAN